MASTNCLVSDDVSCADTFCSDVRSESIRASRGAPLPEYLTNCAGDTPMRLAWSSVILPRPATATR